MVDRTIGRQDDAGPSCPDETALARFAMQQVTPDERLAIFRHLNRCARCASFVEGRLHETTFEQTAEPSRVRRAEVEGRTRAVGAQVGRYVILQLVGRGGMGEVYAAYDPELDRKIALKLVHAERMEEPSSRGRARLLREAQALAKLQHPNVVAVHDVQATGETDVAIAMDFVEGRTLKAWLRGGKRSWREVLKVFLQAGEGLWAAHRKALIHRDFKPENVLVGSDGRVMVTDFGMVRRAHDAPEVARTLGEALKELGKVEAAQPPGENLTETGAVMGTPAYMAPEQLFGLAVDARADQFSFCASMWEALYGKRPIEGRNLKELRRNVAELAAEVPRGAQVPGWIGRVVARGLSLDPAQRYGSMGEVLGALRKDPRRALRRGLGLAAAVLGVLMAVGSVVYIQVNRERRCKGYAGRLEGVWDEGTREQVRAAFVATGRPHAANTFNQVDRLFSRKTRDWVAASRRACEETYLEGSQSDRVLDLRMACLERRLVEVRALAEVLASRADAEVVDKAVQAASSLAPLSECADTQALLADVPPPRDAATREQVEALRSQIAKAEALQVAGKVREGLETVQPLLPAARETGYLPVVAEVLRSIAGHQGYLGKYAKAVEALREAAWTAESAGYDRLRLDVYLELGNALGAGLNRIEEGKAWLRGADAVLNRLGESGQARASWHLVSGQILFVTDDFEGALGQLQQALHMFETSDATYAWGVAKVLSEMAKVYDRMGQYDKAQQQYDRVFGIYEAIVGPDHPNVAAMLNNLAILSSNRGDHERASIQYARALEILEKNFGSENPKVGQIVVNLGAAYLRSGDLERAGEQYARGLSILEKSLGPEHSLVGLAHCNLAELHLLKGELLQALEAYGRSEAIFRETLGPEHPSMMDVRSGLGWTLLRLGKIRQAAANFERVLAMCQGNRCEGPSVVPFSQAQFGLAQALWEAGGDRQRALRLAQDALSAFRAQNTAQNTTMQKDCLTWLAARGAKTQ